MSAGCNACYYASTRPEWVALLVIRNRRDHPCERHATPAPVEPQEKGDQ